VTAHFDDEYCFAATAYRLTQELGGVVDQIVITNGEGGFRYSDPSEKLLGKHLTEEAIGRAELPKIREREHGESAKILGIRNKIYLRQKDIKFTRDIREGVDGIWDVTKLKSALSSQLKREKYDFVITLLPIEEEHAHHKMATILALEAVSKLPPESRPTVLSCSPRASLSAAYPPFTGLKGYPETQFLGSKPLLEFDRSAPFGLNLALNYQIYVNWVIAAHKSQGLLQTWMGRDRFEDFWVFQGTPPEALEKARALGRKLQPNGGAAPLVLW
jgi:LmbE family N-acetylglucosaminyl deacetylase